LDQIPVLGEAVFGQTDKQVKRTELIIFIRPQIIRDGADAHFVAEELRTKLRGSIRAIGSAQTAPANYRLDGGAAASSRPATSHELPALPSYSAPHSAGASRSRWP